jgi:hypothetical protein
MNDILGFQEMRSSIFRSPSSRFLHEQRHECGTGFRHLLHNHNLIALSTSISPKREKVAELPPVLHALKINPILQLLTIAAILVTGFMGSGCAYVTHQPVKYHPYPSDDGASADRDLAKHYNDEEDRNQTGIRYYLSSPYLLVYSDGKGNLSWKVYNLPDQTKLMVATPHQIFAKTTANFTFTNGVLTASKTEADSSAAIKAVIGAIEKVLPLVAGLDDTTRTTKIQAPRLYKIVVGKDTLKLIGIPSKETISISLKPGS